MLPSFSVVRNPYWRFVSGYNYLRNGGNSAIASIADNLAWASLLQSVSLQDFLNLLMDHAQQLRQRQFQQPARAGAGASREKLALPASQLELRMRAHGAKDLVMFLPQHRFLFPDDGCIIEHTMSTSTNDCDGDSQGPCNGPAKDASSGGGGATTSTNRRGNSGKAGRANCGLLVDQVFRMEELSANCNFTLTLLVNHK